MQAQSTGDQHGMAAERSIPPSRHCRNEFHLQFVDPLVCVTGGNLVTITATPDHPDSKYGQRQL